MKNELQNLICHKTHLGQVTKSWCLGGGAFQTKLGTKKLKI